MPASSSSSDTTAADLLFPEKPVVHRRWSLPTLLRHPVAGLSLSVVDQAIMSGTNFLTVVLIGRSTSKHELGIYALATSIVVFMKAIQEATISAPYTMLCHRADSRASYSLSTTIQLLLLSCCAAAALMVAWLTSPHDLDGLRPLLPLLALALPFLLLREFARQMSFAHLQLRSAMILDIAVCVLQLGGLFVVARIGMTVTAAYAVIGLTAAVCTCGWLWMHRAWFAWRPGRLRADLGANWDFGRWVLAGQLIGSAAPYALPWALSYFAGVEAAGLLAAATSIVGLANLLMMGLVNARSPKAALAYAQGGIKQLQPVILRTALLMTGVLSLACLFLALFGSAFAKLLYGEAYAGLGTTITVLAVAGLVNSYGIAVGSGINAMGRPAANLRADIAACAATLVVTFTLLPIFGVLGAALAILAATSAGSGFRAVTYFRLASRECKADATRSEAVAAHV